MTTTARDLRRPETGIVANYLHELHRQSRAPRVAPSPQRPQAPAGMHGVTTVAATPAPAPSR